MAYQEKDGRMLRTMLNFMMLFRSVTMKRRFAYTLGAVALVLLATTAALAIDAPHNYSCTYCHVTHRTLGTKGLNNICFDCHNMNNPATVHQFQQTDLANPFGSTAMGIYTGNQTGKHTSHNWSASDVVPAAGATAPTNLYMNSPSSITGAVSCARCHSIHVGYADYTGTNPKRSKPLLRMRNDQDQMCVDCHKSRNQTSHTAGTHPVSVNYADAVSSNPAGFASTPVNSNPANPSSAMKLVNGQILCSTCHATHHADSNSATFDSNSSAILGRLSSSRGYLLRTDLKGATAGTINICTNCHAGKLSHNGSNQNVQCADCHAGHVDVGDGTKPNVFLIRRYMNISTAAGAVRNRMVMYTSVTSKNFTSPVNGVCNACHTIPAPGGTYPPEHASSSAAVCLSCHSHNGTTGSFSGGCTTCHGYPPPGPATGYTAVDETTSPHQRHAGGGSNYSYGCIQCHQGNTHNSGSTFQDVFINKSGIIASTATAVPAYNTTARTCSAVYCHSDGAPRNASLTPVLGAPQTAIPAWSSTTKLTSCGDCHAALPATNAHTKHRTVGIGNCVICHDATLTDSTTIKNKALHVDGIKTVAFSSTASGLNLSGAAYTIASATCSTVYCHSSGQSTDGSSATPVYASTPPTWVGTAACGSCHETTTMATGSHSRHLAADTNCGNCHTNATSTAYSAATHVNGQIDVADSYTMGGAPGNGYGTCSTASCHADVYGTGTVATPTWGSTGNGCAACHTTYPITATGPATGSHSLTGHAVTCTSCHAAGTTATTVPSTGHADGNIDVANVGYPADVTKHTAGSGYSTCSAASCHANVYGTGTVATPTWGSTGNGCAACHTTYPITATGPATGSHSLTGHAVACTNCHAAGTSTTTVPSTGHADGDIDVTDGYPANVTKHAAGTYTGTCSTASCHANVYGTGTVATPIWGSTGNGCSACHSVAIGTNGPATGSHGVHAGIACTSCHNAGTTTATVPSTGHADGDIDVTDGYPANVTKHAAGTYTGSCSTAVCHGSHSPTWGPNTSNASCTKCHGKATALANYSTVNAWQAAPGYATTGTDIAGNTGTFTNGVSDDPQVGAHDAHLRAVNAYTDRRVLCSDCHAVPVSTQHANGATDYSWSNLVKNIGTTGAVSTRGTLTPGYASGTCSTNYCHGGVLNGGTDTTPVWNDTTYLTTYTKNAANCGKCHGAPPTSGATLGYDHAGITIANTCTECHGHEGNGPTHIDGTLQAAGGDCDSCHGYDTVGGAWGNGSHKDGATAEGWGAHAKHIDHLKTVLGVTLNANTDTYGSAAFNAVCGVCHTQDPANHTMDNSSGRLINFNGATTYKTGSLNPLYNGVSGTSSSVNPKTCSNISCHFNDSPRWQ